MFILGIMLFSILNPVHADTITYSRLNDIYYNLTVDGIYSSNHVTQFYLDGRLAYCIDPGAPINTKTYNASNTWNINSLNEEKKQQIEKIGYYGYEYPGHNTDKYYIAAQELIWQTVKNVDIKWTNSNNQIIDISKEKNEILNLIDKHKIRPSFTNDIINGINGQHLEITDDNNVLENFSLSQTEKHSTKVKDNTLVIDLSQEEAEEEVTLTRKNYDNKTLIIYQYPGSQTLAALRLNQNEILKFKIKSAAKVEPKKEIVVVPSTGIEMQAIHYGVYKFKQINDKKFS